MNKLEIKEQLLAKCVEQQMQSIDDLQKEMDEAQRMSNDYGQPKDRYDAFRTKLLRQKDMYAQQQAKAILVLNTLKKISLKEELKKVEFGAVVIMNKQNLFVAAGLGKIELNGTDYFAISPQVPIFKALAGKKAGDEVVFNANKFIISDIF
ncbi:MAG: hypothetical protein C0595_07335 [Marinilabiliales bacterium]|nr:MAG: hypothetical protein C0595_07335 [Marinilabiliales bacterium]